VKSGVGANLALGRALHAGLVATLMIPPPRWKMALVTVIGVWPVSMLVPWLLNPLTGKLSFILQALCMAVGIVTLLTWAVMPMLVTVLSPWLQDRQLRKRRKPNERTRSDFT
jgi:antibiotic biosynthesis monooxygenase (ABM) superfamily enzyme